jgi:hypothetical protein
MTASVVRSLTEFVRVPHFLDPHGGSCHAPAGGAVHAQLQDVLPPEDAGYQMEARMSICCQNQSWLSHIHQELQ